MSIIAPPNASARLWLAMQRLAAIGENAAGLFKACAKKPVEEPKFLLKFFDFSTFRARIGKGIDPSLAQCIHQAARFSAAFNWPCK